MGLFTREKTTMQQVRKRDPEPQELTDLRLGLNANIAPTLGTKNEDGTWTSNWSEDWANARNIANNALTQQGNLINQLPDALTQSTNLLKSLSDLATTGNIPAPLLNSLNASVNQGLQSSMGSMLSNLAQRGVLNSSVTTQGTNQLSQAAADAFNRNYLTAYQSALSGLGSALQGSQNNYNSILSGLGALGSVPSNAYEGVAAQLMPAFNLWKNWQNSYDTREDYDTIVQRETKPNCITGDTLVTLKDGQEIPVSELKDNDEIKTWDFNKGCVVSAPLMGFFKDNVGDGLDIVRVEFEDGSNVGVIVEHLFFDIDAGKFIAINSDSQEYVGHSFAKVDNEGKIVPVKVSRIYLDGKATETYGPQCSGYLNYLTGGFITGNDGQLALCNMFEYDTEKMTYDTAKKAADLEKYGRLKYEDMNNVVSKELFDNNNFAEFGVAVGKGLLTVDEIREYSGKFKKYYFE